MSDFFYSGQTRRFLLQFSRIFSHFQVEYGISAGEKTFLRVPIRYGDVSRQAQTILQQNSANNLPSVPLMTFYITDFSYDRSRIQAPSFVDRRMVRQREWNEDAQEYEQTQGTAFKVERPMPIPQLLSITLDIWTSSTHMKLQILEQIKTLFNPALEIQSTDNFLDWTSLTTVDLDSESWTSRSIPNGNDDIDITSMKFKLPIWISPPARVTKGGFVHKVIASVYDLDGAYVDAIDQSDLLLGTRMQITPHDYKVLLLDGTIQILPPETVADTNDISSIPAGADSTLNWYEIISEYGKFNEGITQIRFTNPDAADIIGTVTLDPNDVSILNFNVDVDTLPSNTLAAVDAVINPLMSGPGAGLDAAVVGQRYLLTEDTGNIDDAQLAEAWAGSGNVELIASAEDIIEYDGTQWTVIFDTSENTDQHYVSNINTGIQYQSIPDGWIRSYLGIYDGGDWNIVL